MCKETNPPSEGGEVQSLSLRERIGNAQDGALSREDLERLKNQHDVIVKSFLLGEINDAVYRSQLLENESASQAGDMTFDSISEFRFALEILIENKEIVEGILRHENEHMSIALSLGLDACYAIQFMGPKKDTVAFYPSCNVKFPYGMSAEEQRSFLTEIIGAPTDLSPRDKEQLGKK